jgi:hypothetical protein
MMWRASRAGRGPQIDQIGGYHDRQVSVLHGNYGYNLEKAMEEAYGWINNIDRGGRLDEKSVKRTIWVRR